MRATFSKELFYDILNLMNNGAEYGYRVLAEIDKDGEYNQHILTNKDYRDSNAFKQVSINKIVNRDDTNLYFTPNIIKDWKPRSSDNTGWITSLFVDIDDVTVDEAEQRLTDSILPEPTIKVFTGRGVHYYWILNYKNRLTTAKDYSKTWSKLQQLFINELGGDQAVKDLGRLMRIPGTYNAKRGEQGYVYHFDRYQTYAISDLNRRYTSSKVHKLITAERKRYQLKYTTHANDTLTDGGLGQYQHKQERPSQVLTEETTSHEIDKSSAIQNLLSKTGIKEDMTLDQASRIISQTDDEPVYINDEDTGYKRDDTKFNHYGKTPHNIKAQAKLDEIYTKYAINDTEDKTESKGYKVKAQNTTFSVLTKNKKIKSTGVTRGTAVSSSRDNFYYYYKHMRDDMCKLNAMRGGIKEGQRQSFLLLYKYIGATDDEITSINGTFNPPQDDKDLQSILNTEHKLTKVDDVTGRVSNYRPSRETVINRLNITAVESQEMRVLVTDSEATLKSFINEYEVKVSKIRNLVKDFIHVAYVQQSKKTDKEKAEILKINIRSVSRLKKVRLVDNLTEQKDGSRVVLNLEVVSKKERSEYQSKVYQAKVNGEDTSNINKPLTPKEQLVTELIESIGICISMIKVVLASEDVLAGRYEFYTQKIQELNGEMRVLRDLLENNVTSKGRYRIKELERQVQELNTLKVG